MATRVYRCRNCYFTLDVAWGVTEDEAMGQDESILRKDMTRQTIDDVPLLWRCPMCQSDRDSFEEFEEGAEQLKEQREGS